MQLYLFLLLNFCDMDLLTPSFGLIIWTLLAFLIVGFILKKYAWKPILKSLKEREKNISDAILSTEKVKQEMALLKSENETLLVKAREERAIMMREAKETRDKIISEAKEQARQGWRPTKLLQTHKGPLTSKKWLQLPTLKTRLEI